MKYSIWYGIVGDTWMMLALELMFLSGNSCTPTFTSCICMLREMVDMVVPHFGKHPSTACKGAKEPGVCMVAFARP